MLNQINKTLERFQREMYMRLTKNKPVYYVPMEGGKVLLSEGYRAYVYHSNEIYINLGACMKDDVIAGYFTKDGQSQPLEDTKTYLKVFSGVMLHKFSAQDFDVYIDESLIKGVYDDPCCGLYGGGPEKPVVIRGVGSRDVIGLVMPCRYDGMKREHNETADV